MKYYAMMLAIAAGLTFAGCDKKEEASIDSETKVVTPSGEEQTVKVEGEVTTETSN